MKLGLTLALVFGGCAVWFEPASLHADEPQPFPPWRCAANGGINVLYCYLRVSGIPCAYADLLQEQAEEIKAGPCTAASLARLAAKHGVRLQPVSLNMKQLAAGPLPIIVHMDGESPEAGAFLLIQAINGKQLDYVNGPSATIHKMSQEDFRRVWSGIALLPGTGPRAGVGGAVVGFGVGLMGALFVWFIGPRLPRRNRCGPQPQPGGPNALKRRSLGWGCLLTGFMIATVGAPAAAQTSTTEPNGGLPGVVSQQLEKLSAAFATAQLQFSAGGEKGPSIKFSVCFDQGRIYQRYEAREGLLQIRSVHENAFDGKIFYFGEPDVPTGDHPSYLTKFLSSDSTDPQRKVRLFEFPYLDAAGFFAPECVADLEEGSAVSSLVLHHMRISTSTRVEAVGDNLLVTVQIKDPVLARAQEVDLDHLRRQAQTNSAVTPAEVAAIQRLEAMRQLTPLRKVTFRLDPKRGYGVVERDEWTADGKAILHLETGRWKYFEPRSIWLPQRCVITYFSNPSLTEFSASPLGKGVVTLDRISFGPLQKQSFALDYKRPGTLIMDRTTPEARTNRSHQVKFTVAADGTILRGIARNVRRDMTIGKYVFWGGLFAVILVLPPGMLLLQRVLKLRKRPS